MKIGFFILIGILSFKISAQSLAEFCFKHSGDKEQAIKYANQILLGDEKFIHSPGQNCTQIYLSEDRFELLDVFIRRQFGVVKSSASLVRMEKQLHNKGHCSLELREQGKSSGNQNSFQVGTKSKIRSYGAGVSDLFQTQITMMSGKSSEIMTPEGLLKFSCTITNAGVAIVKIEVQNKLMSQVMLQPGQELLLGSLSHAQNSNGRQLDVKKGIGLDQDQNQKGRTYSLKFNSF